MEEHELFSAGEYYIIAKGLAYAAKALSCLPNDDPATDDLADILTILHYRWPDISDSLLNEATDKLAGLFNALN